MPGCLLNPHAEAPLQSMWWHILQSLLVSFAAPVEARLCGPCEGMRRVLREIRGAFIESAEHCVPAQGDPGRCAVDLDGLAVG